MNPIERITVHFLESTNLNKMNLPELSELKLSRSLIAKLLAAAGLGFFAYKTLAIYLLRRRFRHIPGPETNG